MVPQRIIPSYRELPKSTDERVSFPGQTELSWQTLEAVLPVRVQQSSFCVHEGSKSDVHPALRHTDAGLVQSKPKQKSAARAASDVWSTRGKKKSRKVRKEEFK